MDDIELLDELSSGALAVKAEETASPAGEGRGDGESPFPAAKRRSRPKIATLLIARVILAYCEGYQREDKVSSSDNPRVLGVLGLPMG